MRSHDYHKDNKNVSNLICRKFVAFGVRWNFLFRFGQRVSTDTSRAGSGYQYKCSKLILADEAAWQMYLYLSNTQQTLIFQFPGVM